MNMKLVVATLILAGAASTVLAEENKGAESSTSTSTSTSTSASATTTTNGAASSTSVESKGSIVEVEEPLAPVHDPAADKAAADAVDGSEPTEATAEESDTSEGEEPLVAFDAPAEKNPFDEVKAFDSPFEQPLGEAKATTEKKDDATEGAGDSGGAVTDQEIEKIADEYLETSAALANAAPDAVTLDTKAGVVKTAPAGDDLKDAQRALAAKGYAVKADGKAGPKTLEALKAFQRDNGLTASGSLDEATRAKLGLVR